VVLRCPFPILMGTTSGNAVNGSIAGVWCAVCLLQSCDGVRITRSFSCAHSVRRPCRTANPAVSFSVGSWLPLGPVPLASDASGNGTQDYHQVAGRSTAVAIDQWNFGIERAHAIRLLHCRRLFHPRFNGAVSLTCSAGLPAGAQCIVSPSTPLTPGNSAVDVVMNISTRANSAQLGNAREGELFSTSDVDSTGCDCDWRERFGKSKSDQSAAAVRLRGFLPDDDGICLVCRCERRRRRWWSAASARDLSHHGDRNLFGHAFPYRAEHHSDARRKLKGFVAYDYTVADIVCRPPS
jgi:hypothetical protein